MYAGAGNVSPQHQPAAAAPVSTELFTEALQVAFPDATRAPLPLAQRQQAEEYLLRLQQSPLGFSLAGTILSSEPFDQLRSFWAFTALIEHMGGSGGYVPANGVGRVFVERPASVDEVYTALVGWIRRMFAERQLPDFILNKHAHVMVIALHAFYPDRWRSFFDDLFEMLQMRDQFAAGPIQVVTYFLRIFEYVDEVVICRSVHRDAMQRQRDMQIKDTMRETMIGRLVEEWYQTLSQYHSTQGAVDMICHCLSVMDCYVEWIDVNLITTPQWVNILYFLMSLGKIRVRASACICKIVDKKQLPQVKAETMTQLRIAEVLPMLVPTVTSAAPQTAEDESFLMSVVRLVVSASRELCLCYDGGIVAAAGPMKAILPHALSLFQIPLFHVRDELTPSLTAYIKHTMATEQEVTHVMQSLFERTCQAAVLGPLGDDLAHGGGDPLQEIAAAVQHEAVVESPIEKRNLDQRKQIHNALRLLYRRHPALVGQHCCDVTRNVISRGADQVPANEAEGVLRYIYEIGEAVKMDTLRSVAGQEPHPFAALLAEVVGSPMINHPSPAVHLAYFELLDRYHPFFISYKDQVPSLLQHLLHSPHGVVNPDAKVRSRVCYLFSHLSLVLKGQFVEYAATIVQVVQGYIGPTGPLRPSDRCDLYETLGTLLAASNISSCADVLTLVVSHMNQVVTECASTGITEPAAQALSDDISYLTSLAKGVGGTDAARMPESPPMGPTSAPGFPAGARPPNASASAAQSDPSSGAAVFLRVLDHVLQCVAGCLTYPQIRDKTIVFLQQIINIVAADALPTIVAVVPSLLQGTSLIELPKVLRIVYQTVNKTRAAGIDAVGGTLLPQITACVAHFAGDISRLSIEHNVVSESEREIADVYKAYFQVLHAIATTSCIGAFQHPGTQPYLTGIMTTLLASLKSPMELDLTKTAFSVLIRLTSAWCDPGSSIESFLFDGVFPTALEVLSSPSSDLRDAKVFVVISELCSLMRMMAVKLGEAGLYRLYTVLTTTAGAEQQPANEFCAMIRTHAEQMAQRPTQPPSSTGLRLQGRMLLLAIQERRKVAEGA